MSTKLTYTGAEVQELLDKIEKGDFDNAKTLEGHPASYFAIESEFTSLAESFATEQGRVDTLCGYFNNGSANDALSLGGQLPSYYATALQYEILQQTLTDFKSLFDSMFEKDSDGNIHAKLSLWSSGGITAGGVGSGGSGGGGISYNRLDSWSDYSADKSGWVLSALLGKDLDNRVSALTNAGYITASYLAPYALRSEIPSLDGYATESFVTSQGYITASALDGYATQSWVGDSYLSKIGGTVNGETVLQHSNSLILTIKRTGSGASLIRYNGDEGLRGGIGFGTDGVARIWDNTLSGNYPILTSDNFSQYALPLTGGIMAKNSYIDWGNTDGFEDYSAYSNGFKILGYNAGSGDYRGGIHVGVRYGWQLTRNAGSEVFQIRNYSPSSASWGDWKTIAFTSDIPTKLSQLTDDVVAGKYLSLAGGTVNGILSVASVLRMSDVDGIYKIILQRDSSGNILFGGGFAANNMYIDADVLRIRANETKFSQKVTAPSFIGNLTGNADSATYATTSTFLEARNYNSDINANNLYYGRSFVLRLAGSNANLPSNMSYGNILYIGGADTGFMLAGSYSHDKLLFRRGTNANGPAQSIITNTWKTIAFTDSNVASATKLATPRTIWGQSFDGTQDVTGALTAPAITTNSLTIGGVTLTYDSVNEALCVNGNMYALGGITAGGAGISAYTSLESRVARLEQQLNIS